MSDPTLFDQPTPPPVPEMLPAVRRTDPDTSQQAAAKQTPSKRAGDQTRVLLCHAEHAEFGLDDFALARILGGKQTSLGKRRGELVAMGLIVATDRRGRSDTDSPVIIWQATEAGLRMAAELAQAAA